MREGRTKKEESLEMEIEREITRFQTEEIITKVYELNIILSKGEIVQGAQECIQEQCNVSTDKRELRIKRS